MSALLQCLSAWMIILFLLSTRLPTSRSFVLETVKRSSNHKNKNFRNQVRAATTRILGHCHCANDKASGGIVGRQNQRRQRRLSMVAEPTEPDHVGGTVTDRTNARDCVVGGFPLSNKIVQTLDPCVVKTKEWMEKYAHLWEGEQQQGIVSLAQGVVYWKPPPSCRKALVDAVTLGGDGDDAGERDAAPTVNPLPTFPDDSHVVHVFSFSKGYAMAGYRCGYLVTHKNDASKGKFLSQMLKVQDTIPIGPPRLSQHVALGALRQGAMAARNSSSPPELYSPSSKEWVYQKYATLDASRSYILEALSSLPQQIGGSGSMYVMGKLPKDLTIVDTNESGGRDGDDTTVENNDNNVDEPTDVLFCRTLVRDYGIAIIPGSFCGFPGWIRVCYANLPPEKTKKAAERLRKGIEDLTGQS